MKFNPICECGAMQVLLKFVPVGDGVYTPVYECLECGKVRGPNCECKFKIPDDPTYWMRRAMSGGFMVCEEAESYRHRPTDEEQRLKALEEAK